MTKSVLIFFILSVSNAVFALPIPSAKDYRDYTQKVRKTGNYIIPFPGAAIKVQYSFELADPIYPEPLLDDLYLVTGPKPNKYFYRSFFDRISFKEDSFLKINDETVPLACIFVHGQDNRFSAEVLSPLLPEFLMKVYIVANDFSCQGPIRPGWPATGGQKENWDTLIYFEIKDPTIMLPIEAKLRYRWNEHALVLTSKDQP